MMERDRVEPQNDGRSPFTQYIEAASFVLVYAPYHRIEEVNATLTQQATISKIVFANSDRGLLSRRIIDWIMVIFLNLINIADW
jgi:hypothetical protein